MRIGNIRCRTNLDSAKFEEWPKLFLRAPVVGESVQAASGRKLRVSNVTHAVDKTGEPYVDVELHLFPGETVADDVAKHRR
jgi:hypothetical protein